MQNIGFIGAGNMAGAIITKILDRRILPADKVGIFDVDADTCRRYKAEGHPVYQSIEQLVRASSTVVLAVKPQIFSKILPELKAAITPEKLIVSIAAGVSAEYIREGVGFDCKLILVMPNTPLLVGVGATALARVEPASPQEFEEIRKIFALSGIAEEVPPDKMNEVMSVHSTMPAYIYLFAKTITDCAERAGIDREVANRLFSQTLVGSAWMMTQTGKSHQELIDMVCSPGGTTLAGLAALDEAGFVSALEKAFEASTRRAEELAQ